MSTAEKKSNRKGVLVFFGIIIILTPLIYFGREYLAKESAFTYVNRVIDGDTLTFILGEKTSSPYNGYINADDHQRIELNDSHYGYYLEVYDSAANKSLDKLNSNRQFGKYKVHLLYEFLKTVIFGSYLPRQATMTTNVVSF